MRLQGDKATEIPKRTVQKIFIEKFITKVTVLPREGLSHDGFQGVKSVKISDFRQGVMLMTI